ncbi:MAG: hypothetical protein IJB79_07655 [Candidatus Gastranaerophilales bacterium]|nr:hypothetical protein [Candidatus Gastranaerophilales bacterium]
MGLDGISVNQLRITPEHNSAELNNVAKFSLENNHKVVDGLANGQKIDPDKEKEHENPELAEQFVDLEEETQEEIEEEIIKYDLSDSNKYLLKLEEESNNILIIEKSSSKVVQRINADELSSYVGFLSNSQGSMINRKF